MAHVPDAALAQHLAIIGKTGAGKSYATRSIVERLLDDGRRVCILDYTGVWRGLRSSANGKRGAYPVVIFGGEHGDVPLNEHAGPAVAKLVAGGNRPCILDLDGMTVGAQQRFVTAFLEELYRLNTQPLHLVIEEIDEFAPQTGAPGTERMIGAVARIFQRGRRKGFRAIAITQRPANVHKRVLTQCNALVMLRLVAPQDRKAISEWIRGHADDEEGRRIIDALPKLARGEGFVWAPEQDVLQQVKFPAIKTFDTMRAPEEGEDHEPASWATVDLDAIRTEMADAVKEADANDPKKLRSEIARLEREMRQRDRAPASQAVTIRNQLPPTEPDPRAIRAAEDRGRAIGHDEGKRVGIAEGYRMAQREAQAALAALKPNDATLTAMPARPAVAPPIAKHTLAPQLRASAPRKIDCPSADIPAGEKAVLVAIASRVNGATRQQVTIDTGYKRATRDAYILRLKQKAYVDQHGERVMATGLGVAALGSDYDPLPVGDDLRRVVLGRLPEGERKVLQALIASYPSAVSRDDLEAKTGYKRATRDAYILRLRIRELVEVVGPGAVKAADDLFSEAA